MQTEPITLIQHTKKLGERFLSIGVIQTHIEIMTAYTLWNKLRAGVCRSTWVGFVVQADVRLNEEG